jgi:hypothetical protein
LWEIFEIQIFVIIVPPHPDVPVGGWWSLAARDLMSIC